ncbi:MAG TPA: hypothetical protein PKK00_10665 [Bacteroidales bacterium]|nr:hypothetical protein [Bacteroidales bacterium]HPS17786.1 hypothetical protein [Bacteroidales bacterium]
MKKINLILITFIINTIASFAQTPVWEWVKNSGGEKITYVT